MEILICGMTENQGGIEVYLANLVKEFDPKKIKLSFVQEKESIAYEELLREKNCSIYKIPWRRKNPIRHIIKLKALLLEHKEIELLYVNAMSGACLPSVIGGKLAGKKVLVHSRNNNTKNILAHRLLRPFLNMLVDYRFACSKLAAGYMFGKSHCEIISNGIDFEKFYYNKKIRDALRTDLFKDEDVFVIGYVGNLTYQKNVLFLIDVFAAFADKHDNARLVMLGDGEMRQQVELAIEAHSLSDKVILLGKTKDTSKYYQIFDLFLFPSRYEGFGNVLIEAQISGLPCVCSKNVIPMSTKISDRITYVELSDSIVTWQKAMEKYMHLKRSAYVSTGEEKKYELHTAVAHIESILLNI